MDLGVTKQVAVPFARDKDRIIFSSPSKRFVLVSLLIVSKDWRALLAAISEMRLCMVTISGYKSVRLVSRSLRSLGEASWWSVCREGF